MFQARTDKWDFYCVESRSDCTFPDTTQSPSRDLLAHCNQPKPADEKNKHGRGKREEGLNGRKTRSDEQNGPYVSGRVEEDARNGEDILFFFFFFLKSRPPALH